MCGIFQFYLSYIVVKRQSEVDKLRRGALLLHTVVTSGPTVNIFSFVMDMKQRGITAPDILMYCAYFLGTLDFG